MLASILLGGHLVIVHFVITFWVVGTLGLFCRGIAPKIKSTRQHWVEVSLLLAAVLGFLAILCGCLGIWLWQLPQKSLCKLTYWHHQYWALGAYCGYMIIGVKLACDWSLRRQRLGRSFYLLLTVSFMALLIAGVYGHQMAVCVARVG